MNETTRAVLRRLRSDWPGKVGAVIVALVLWWVAISDPGSTAQRSLIVPLQIVGAEANEVAVGVPPRVEVVVSGPSDRMDRLGPGEIEARLDLADVDGEFAREVDARVPSSLRLIGVVPTEVIGRLEAVRARELPVRVTLAPPEEARSVASVRVEPAVATVEARDLVLDQVAEIVATRTRVDERERSVVLVPVDANGVPVSEARVVPERATVRVTLEPRMATEMRPLVLIDPELAGVSIDALEPDVLELVGTQDRLDAIERVVGRVPDATSSLPAGRYDLPVRFDLPPGVATHDQPVVTIRVQPVDTSSDAASSP